MLAEVGGCGIDRTSQSAILRQLGATDHVDRNARAVGTVLHRETKLKVHWNPAEHRTFHAQEADLVVVLPRHVVRWADVHIVGLEPFSSDRLHRLGLGDLLGG
jgi:hypothetical protein